MKRTTGLVILALAFGGGAAAQNAAPPQMPIFPQQTPEEKALSDAATMLPLSGLPALLKTLIAIETAAKS